MVSKKQGVTEKATEYLQALQVIAKDRSFQRVTDVLYREKLIKNSFISGLSSAAIRQRLQKRKEITLQ